MQILLFNPCKLIYTFIGCWHWLARQLSNNPNESTDAHALVRASQSFKPFCSA
jgi:hypothetical protein